LAYIGNIGMYSHKRRIGRIDDKNVTTVAFMGCENIRYYDASFMYRSGNLLLSQTFNGGLYGKNQAHGSCVAGEQKSFIQIVGEQRSAHAGYCGAQSDEERIAGE
jgi:hypothetical protein